VSPAQGGKVELVALDLLCVGEPWGGQELFALEVGSRAGVDRQRLAVDEMGAGAAATGLALVLDVCLFLYIQSEFGEVDCGLVTGLKGKYIVDNNCSVSGRKNLDELVYERWLFLAFLEFKFKF
jgi:hypothetical protein